jgi:hypothetical protein
MVGDAAAQRVKCLVQTTFPVRALSAKKRPFCCATYTLP